MSDATYSLDDLIEEAESQTDGDLAQYLSEIEDEEYKIRASPMQVYDINRTLKALKELGYDYDTSDAFDLVTIEVSDCDGCEPEAERTDPYQELCRKRRKS